MYTHIFTHQTTVHELINSEEHPVMLYNFLIPGLLRTAHNSLITYARKKQTVFVNI
jgi:hypothetical protein